MFQESTAKSDLADDQNNYSSDQDIFSEDVSILEYVHVNVIL